MKFAEIKNLNVSELRKKLDQLNHQMFDARMKLSMKRLPNPLQIRQLRKDKARIQTILSQKNKEIQKINQSSKKDQLKK